MAETDYTAKTGKAPAGSKVKENSDDTFSIILSDENGDVLDIYTIDPGTGKGNDRAGNDVDLPQTGNHSVKTAAAAAAAVSLLIIGATVVYVSGIKRKKTDEE